VVEVSLYASAQVLSIIIGFGADEMLFSHPLPPTHEWIKLKTHTIAVNGGEPST